MTSFHWNTERKTPTLERLRAFVNDVARDLDPDSRYVKELRVVLNASQSVEDYLARLGCAERVDSFRQDGAVPSQGERGRSWLDGSTWEGMSVYERTLANLLTGETRMMWAGEGATNFALLSQVLASLPEPRRVLSIPCSTGKEPYSIAIAGLRANLELSVVGVDRQASYLERARSGVLVTHWRDRELPGVDVFLSWDEATQRSRIADEVRACCTFEQGDVLTNELPPGPFGLVSCRNLLGYFRDASLATAFRNVSSRVAPGGVLLLDGFVTSSPEMADVQALLLSEGFTRRFPGTADAHYYDR
jgi:chemotaxis methyl-accepting protein methylase